MTKTVLAVEDDELSMRLLHDILECLGHVCVPAYDGFAALTIVKEKPVDLILMDVQLPGLSGMDLTRIIKSDRALRHIPIIAVTACAMAGDEGKIMASGCDAYIAKPFAMAHFMGLVREMLQPRARRTRLVADRAPSATGQYETRRRDRHTER